MGLFLIQNWSYLGFRSLPQTRGATKGIFTFIFFQTYLRHWEGTVICNVLEKEWGRGSAEVAYIAEIAASSASKEKVMILIKKRALEKIPWYHILFSVCVHIVRSGHHGLWCKDGKACSVHLLLCLLPLKGSSFRLKHPMLSWWKDTDVLAWEEGK